MNKGIYIYGKPAKREYTVVIDGIVWAITDNRPSPDCVCIGRYGQVAVIQRGSVWGRKLALADLTPAARKVFGLLVTDLAADPEYFELQVTRRGKRG